MLFSYRNHIFVTIHLFYRRMYLFGQDDESIPKTEVYWKNRQLDVIDCGFLARLLNVTFGVPKPPHELPMDVLYEKRP